MPSETRFFRADQHTVNTITAYKLLTLNTALTKSATSLVWRGKRTVFTGVQVYRVEEDGTHTELTSGISAIVQKLATQSPPDMIEELSAIWDCPQTALNLTDAIKVEVYQRPRSTGPYTLQATFITDQLNATQLDAATWTFYYWVLAAYDVDNDETTANFFWGSASRNSRITNFTYTPGIVPTKIQYLDGLVCVSVG